VNKQKYHLDAAAGAEADGGLGEEGAYNGLSLGADLGALAGLGKGQALLVVDNVHEDLLGRLAEKGREAKDHLVHHAANGPKVHAAVVAVAAQHFDRHVVGRPHHRVVHRAVLLM
jgi:hypothetical protein